MAIYINFTNRTLNYYTDDVEKLSGLKPISSESLLESNNDNVEKLELNNEEESILELDESIKDESLKQNNSLEVSKNNIENLNYDEKYKFMWKVSEQDFINLESFVNAFSNNEIIIPDELLSILKLEKQVLILPDDIIAFDTVITPILSFFKSNQALNLKVSIDFNNIDSFGKTFKLVRKAKPNALYAVQLVKQKIAKSFMNYFSDNGIKIKGVNFYSAALASFYINHIRNAKNASIIVKISETQTTILAIIHGFVVGTETLNCGEKDVYRNSTYRSDEYSRRSLSHKFICYAVSNLTESNNDKIVTKDKIEKAYSKTKTNPHAGNFQSRSINIIDLIRKKVDDMIMLLSTSSFKTNIESVFVDVKNDEIFAKLKLANAVKVYYPEYEIFKSCKNSKMFNFNKLNLKNTNKGLSWKNLWSKGKKKA